MSVDNLIPPKFCKNCRHLLTGYNKDYTQARCNAEQNQDGIDLVSGEILLKNNSPRNLRDDESACGKEGKWFVLYVYPAEQYKQDGKEEATRSRVGKASLDIGM